MPGTGNFRKMDGNAGSGVVKIPKRTEFFLDEREKKFRGIAIFPRDCYDETT
jgi:hypothetical protein